METCLGDKARRCGLSLQYQENRKKNLFVRPFVKNEKELEDIFITYDFEQIIYFSNYLTFHGETRGEAEMLRKILQLCRGKRNMRIVYLTGPERLYDVPTGKTLLVSEMEICAENTQNFIRSL